MTTLEKKGIPGSLIARQLELGASIRNVSKKLGISYGIVYYFARKYGIKTNCEWKRPQSIDEQEYEEYLEYRKNKEIEKMKKLEEKVCIISQKLQEKEKMEDSAKELEKKIKNMSKDLLNQ